MELQRRHPGSLPVAVLGAINWDVSIFEMSFPGPGEEVPVVRVSEGPGGKGANVSVAAARVLGRDKVSFVGAVGDDPLSAQLVSGLEDDGVFTGGVVRIKGEASGRAYVIVDSRGAKTIHTHLGANEAFTPVRLNKASKNALSACRVAVVMDLPVPTAEAAASVARRPGTEVVYSPGVRAAAGSAGLGRVIGIASTLVVNEAELEHLCPGEQASSAMSRLTKSHTGLTLIETRGPLGCAVAASGVIHTVPGVNLAWLGLKAVNSTGAGDAFLGVYAGTRSLGLGTRDAISLAVLAGALKATKAETRGSPTRAELDRALGRLRSLRRWPPAWRRSRA